MTNAQESALRRFKEIGDSGIIDRYGRMVVRGEELKSIDPSTWLRLLQAGKMLVKDGRFHLAKD